MKPETIGNFTLYRKKPNQITCGSLYTAELELNHEKRTIRVWLPDTYDFSCESKRFPVIYMSDGQNLVDRYTSPYGEWNIEEHVAHLIKEKKTDGIIVVGIDCPKDDAARMYELCPPYAPDKYPEVGTKMSNRYGTFLFRILKPLIDREFHTLPGKRYTGVGGSSMGGLMAFYLGCRYKSKVGFSLCFSPAFFLYKKETLKKSLNQWNPDPETYGKFFFYVGGEGYEKKFVAPTITVFKKMVKAGFESSRIAFVYDSRQIHHEDSWSEYFETALQFLIF